MTPIWEPRQKARGDCPRQGIMKDIAVLGPLTQMYLYGLSPIQG